MSFLDALQKGIMSLPYCEDCQQEVWPPSDCCRRCLGYATLRPWNHDDAGKVVEFASQDGTVFAICRFGAVGLLGEIKSSRCHVGMAVRLACCGMRNGAPFYEFEAAS